MMPSRAPLLPLPPLYLVTPDPGNGINFFLEQLEQALAADIRIRLVQFRAKSLSTVAYRALAQQVLVCCRRHGARLLLNGDPALLSHIDADGVHLDGARLAACLHRPLGADKLLSAACHNEQQIMQAISIRTDFVTLSPVLHTASHPGGQTLGWDRFAALAILANQPVYALGGMHPDLLETARQHSAYGVAGIEAFWRR
jgi:thiamine-phosphate diphosphorylase